MDQPPLLVTFVKPSLHVLTGPDSNTLKLRQRPGTDDWLISSYPEHKIPIVRTEAIPVSRIVEHPQAASVDADFGPAIAIPVPENRCVTCLPEPTVLIRNAGWAPIPIYIQRLQTIAEDADLGPVISIPIPHPGHIACLPEA